MVVDFIDSIDGKNIEEVFDRVNRNARNLLPQELRHARYNGWFINFTEKESDKDFWWNFKINTRGRDKRMKNVQFVSELLMIIIENNIIGFDQDHIDSIYAKYDDEEELNETGEFSTEEFTTRLNDIKTFLLGMEAHNSSVTNYAAGPNNNFYTLWAYIQLSNPTDIGQTAERYAEFMDKVKKVKELQAEATPVEESVLVYFSNSTGAVTDFTQRNNRLIALTQSL